jgi:hypothetical protein
MSPVPEPPAEVKGKRGDCVMFALLPEDFA